MAKNKHKSLQRRVQDRERMREQVSSPQTVYEVPKWAKSDEQFPYYDPDRELTEPERTPIGGWNTFMQIKSNPLDELYINPNKKPPTESDLRRWEKLRQRAGSGQQGADIAKRKLPPGQLTDLPQFLKSEGPQVDYTSPFPKFDEAMDEFRDKKGQMTNEEIIESLKKAGELRKFMTAANIGMKILKGGVGIGKSLVGASLGIRGLQ